MALSPTDPSLIDVNSYHLGTRDTNSYLKPASLPSPPMTLPSGFSTPAQHSVAPTPTGKPRPPQHEPTTSPAPIPFPSANMSVLHIPSSLNPTATPLSPSPETVPAADAASTLTHSLFEAPVTVRPSAVDALIEAAGGPTPALVSLNRLRAECTGLFRSFEELTQVVRILSSPYKDLTERDGEVSDIFHLLPPPVSADNGPSVPPTPMSSTGYAISYDDEDSHEKFLTTERKSYYDKAALGAFKDLMFSPLTSHKSLFDGVMKLLKEDVNLFWERFVIDKKSELAREIRARKEKVPYKPRSSDGTASANVTPAPSAPSTPLHRSMTPNGTPMHKGLPSPAYTPASFLSPSPSATPAHASTPSSSYKPADMAQPSPSSSSSSATTFYRNRVHNRRPLPLTFAQLIKQQHRLTQLRLAVTAAIKLEAEVTNNSFSSVLEQKDAFVVASGSDSSPNDSFSGLGTAHPTLCIRREFVKFYSGCLFTPLPMTITYEDLHELCIGALGVLPMQRALNTLILGAKQHRLASISLRELGGAVSVMAITMAVHSDVLLPVVRGSTVSALAAEDREKALEEAQGDIIKAITQPVVHMDTFLEEDEDGEMKTPKPTTEAPNQERPSLLQIATAAAEVAAIGTGLSASTQFYTQACYLQSQGLSVPCAYVSGELTPWQDDPNEAHTVHALMVVEESVDPADVIVEDIDLNKENLRVGDREYHLNADEDDDAEEDSTNYLQEYAETIGSLRREIADKTASQLNPDDRNDWSDKRALRKENRARKRKAGVKDDDLSPWESENDDDNLVFMNHRRTRISELRNLQKDLDRAQRDFAKKQQTPDFKRKELLRQRRAVVSSFKNLCSKTAVITTNEKVIAKTRPGRSYLMLADSAAPNASASSTNTSEVDTMSLFFTPAEPESVAAKYLNVIADEEPLFVEVAVPETKTETQPSETTSIVAEVDDTESGDSDAPVEVVADEAATEDVIATEAEVTVESQVATEEDAAENEPETVRLGQTAGEPEAVESDSETNAANSAADADISVVAEDATAVDSIDSATDATEAESQKDAIVEEAPQDVVVEGVAGSVEAASESPLEVAETSAVVAGEVPTEVVTDAVTETHESSEDAATTEAPETALECVETDLTSSDVTDAVEESTTDAVVAKDTDASESTTEEAVLTIADSPAAVNLHDDSLLGAILDEAIDSIAQEHETDDVISDTASDAVSDNASADDTQADQSIVESEGALDESTVLAATTAVEADAETADIATSEDVVADATVLPAADAAAVAVADEVVDTKPTEFESDETSPVEATSAIAEELDAAVEGHVVGVAETKTYEVDTQTSDVDAAADVDEATDNPQSDLELLETLSAVDDIEKALSGSQEDEDLELDAFAETEPQTEAAPAATAVQDVANVDEAAEAAAESTEDTPRVVDKLDDDESWSDMDGEESAIETSAAKFQASTDAPAEAVPAGRIFELKAKSTVAAADDEDDDMSFADDIGSFPVAQENEASFHSETQKHVISDEFKDDEDDLIKADAEIAAIFNAPSAAAAHALFDKVSPAKDTLGDIDVSPDELDAVFAEEVKEMDEDVPVPIVSITPARAAAIDVPEQSGVVRAVAAIPNGKSLASPVKVILPTKRSFTAVDSPIVRPATPDTASYGGALALLKSLNLLSAEEEAELMMDW